MDSLGLGFFFEGAEAAASQAGAAAMATIETQQQTAGVSYFVDCGLVSYLPSR